MKKIIFLIIITIIFFIYTASSKLLYAGVYGRLEGGYDISNPRSKYYVMTTELGYKYTLYGITLQPYGGWTTWAQYSSGGRPFEDIYTIGGYIKYNGFFAHVKHYCAHPVVSQYSNSIQKANYTGEWWAGNITTASFGYEFELQ